jgi:hypothetical protein
LHPHRHRPTIDSRTLPHTDEDCLVPTPPDEPARPADPAADTGDADRPARHDPPEVPPRVVVRPALLYPELDEGEGARKGSPFTL